MLFKSESVLESEKERNFYSKVFAGYYFNELIPSYEERLQAFCKLLQTQKQTTFSGPMNKSFLLSPESTHVTFDFHGYLLDDKNDRGELADILVADMENKSAVAIEVKLLSDWSYEKDIEAASKRFKSLLKKDNFTSFAQVLLIKQAKLQAAQRAANSPGSNWSKLSCRELPYPLVILTWEDIAKNCNDSGGEIIGHFINDHIKKSRKCFRESARSLLGLKNHTS